MSGLIDALRDLSEYKHDDFSIGNEAADEIERLQKIEAAAKNLVEVRGRYNTESAFNRLKESLK